MPDSFKLSENSDVKIKYGFCNSVPTTFMMEGFINRHWNTGRKFQTRDIT